MAVGTVRTYSADEVVVTYDGVRIEGFGDAEFVSIAPAAAEYEAFVGVDGEVTRAKQNNPLRNVTITVASSSESNDFLSGQARLDRTTPGRAVPVLSIRDLNGTSIHEGKAWIQTEPTVGYARAVTTHGWVFDLVRDDLTSNIGGNVVI